MNGPNTRIRVSTRTDSIDPTRITTIPRKKNRRRKSTGVTAVTIKTTADMTITDRQTGVAASKDLAVDIGSTGSNDATRKAPTTICTRSRAKTNHSHRDIIEGQNKIRNNQRSSGNGTHHQLHQKRSLASVASCVNNSVTTQHNAHSGKAKVRPTTRSLRIFNRLQHNNKQRMRIGWHRTKCVKQPKRGSKRLTQPIRNA